MNHIVYTPELVTQVKQFLLTGQTPQGMPRSTRYKFLHRYNNGTFQVKDDNAGLPPKAHLLRIVNIDRGVKLSDGNITS